MEVCISKAFPFHSIPEAGATLLMELADTCPLGGLVTDSQLFPFAAGEKSLALAPKNAGNATCLVASGDKLDQAACSGDGGQLFSVV